MKRTEDDCTRCQCNVSTHNEQFVLSEQRNEAGGKDEKEDEECTVHTEGIAKQRIVHIAR